MVTARVPVRTAVVVALALVAAPLAAEDVNRIILRINDEIFTLYEYEQLKAREVTSILSDQELGAAQRQEMLSRLGQMILQQKFRDMMLVSRARQLGLTVDEGQINEALREFQRRYELTDHTALIQALASAGMTLEDLRERLRGEITWSQVVGREVHAKIEIGDEQLRAIYRNNADDYRVPEQRWLKEYIVREDSGMATEERRRMAAEIRDQLAAGGDPEEVLGLHRDLGETTGLIDLGWLRRDELEDTLAEAAWALQPGEYSSPVAARGGEHVLHLVDLREATLRPFSEVQEEILARERNRRFDKQLRTYLAELERTAYIRENLPPDAVGYRRLSADYTPEDELEVFRRPVEELGDEEEAEAEDAGAEENADPEGQGQG